MRPALTEKSKDRIATAVIRVGGIVVILVVVAIVVNISLEALPLFGRASAGPLSVVANGIEALAVGSDPRRESHWAISTDGTIRFFSERGGPELDVIDLDVEPPLAVDHEIHGLISVIDAAGGLRVGPREPRGETQPIR
jgi:ABC-type uncharacterized transport system permease subunit